MFLQKRRYSFWKVFWVMLGLYIFFGLISIIALSLLPHESVNVNAILSWKHMLQQSISFLFSSVYFYFTLNIFYRLFQERKTFIPFLKTGVIAAIICFGYQLAMYYILPQTRSTKMPGFGILLFSFAMATFMYLAMSLLISYLTYLRDERKQQKILEEQKMQLEIEKSQANFNFLKAQINPHFLHNTLNFLYAKSIPYSAELSEGILTLSDIMRYALSEGNAKNGKAPLRDEIEHVRNVIKIQQLRFSNNLNVQFDVEGVVNGATIIPFVLITLVENAFKHGDLKSIDAPITIKVKISGGQIYFYCRNKKKTGPKGLSTGSGLDNIKKRLDLAYGKNYSLNIKDEAEFYTTELTIKEL